jgi:purine nucleosidase
LKLVLAALALLAIGLAVTLALPLPKWRTGDQGLAPLAGAPAAPAPALPGRVWIDTDAACGYSARTDPDDCFAIALLLRSPRVEVVGISAVAGNAPREVVDATVRALAGTRASDLRAALEQGPLTLLALGPLTHIAAVLSERPELRHNVARLVAVMGRRPGHLFHPAEGAGGGMLLGHGPVFRDFNFAMDPEAARQVVAMQLPTTLLPYDAARGVQLTAAELDRLGRTVPWVVERSRGWLEYWREDIGRDGFYPFDLLAAAYVLEPSAFRCVSARMRVAEDRTMWFPWRPEALLVGLGVGAPVTYCIGMQQARGALEFFQEWPTPR